VIIPDKIEIQVVDSSGQPNPLENVLFGLKLFRDANSWYTYSLFKSNHSGHIILTRQDIIDNTEIKNEKFSIASTSTHIELRVWEGEQTEQFKRAIGKLMQAYDDDNFIEADLKRRGVKDYDIEKAIFVTQNKAIEDKRIYESIKNAINNSVNIKTRQIEDHWTDSQPKFYKFTID
jgi:hypothetical protein